MRLRTSLGNTEHHGHKTKFEVPANSDTYLYVEHLAYDKENTEGNPNQKIVNINGSKFGVEINKDGNVLLATKVEHVIGLYKDQFTTVRFNKTGEVTGLDSAKATLLAGKVKEHTVYDDTITFKLGYKRGRVSLIVEHKQAEMQKEEEPEVEETDGIAQEITAEAKEVVAPKKDWVRAKLEAGTIQRGINIKEAKIGDILTIKTENHYIVLKPITFVTGEVTTYRLIIMRALTEAEEAGEVEYPSEEKRRVMPPIEFTVTDKTADGIRLIEANNSKKGPQRQLMVLNGCTAVEINGETDSTVMDFAIQVAEDGTLNLIANTNLDTTYYTAAGTVAQLEPYLIEQALPIAPADYPTETPVDDEVLETEMVRWNPDGVMQPAVTPADIRKRDQIVKGLLPAAPVYTQIPEHVQEPVANESCEIALNSLARVELAGKEEMILAVGEKEDFYITLDETGKFVLKGLDRTTSDKESIIGLDPAEDIRVARTIESMAQDGEVKLKAVIEDGKPVLYITNLKGNISYLVKDTQPISSPDVEPAQPEEPTTEPIVVPPVTTHQPPVVNIPEVPSMAAADVQPLPSGATAVDDDAVQGPPIINLGDLKPPINGTEQRNETFDPTATARIFGAEPVGEARTEVNGATDEVIHEVEAELPPMPKSMLPTREIQLNGVTPNAVRSKAGKSLKDAENEVSNQINAIFGFLKRKTFNNVSAFEANPDNILNGLNRAKPQIFHNDSPEAYKVAVQVLRDHLNIEEPEKPKGVVKWLVSKLAPTEADMQDRDLTQLFYLIKKYRLAKIEYERNRSALIEAQNAQIFESKTKEFLNDLGTPSKSHKFNSERDGFTKAANEKLDIEAYNKAIACPKRIKLTLAEVAQKCEEYGFGFINYLDDENRYNDNDVVREIGTVDQIDPKSDNLMVQRILTADNYSLKVCYRQSNSEQDGGPAIVIVSSIYCAINAKTGKYENFQTYGAYIKALASGKAELPERYRPTEIMIDIADAKSARA